MRDLCPQHNQSISLCDALDRVLNTGVVALGELKISVADIDLIYLGLQLVVTSIENGRAPDRAGGNWPKPGGSPAEWREERGVDSPNTKSACASIPSPPVQEAGLAVRRPIGRKPTLTASHPDVRAPEKNGLGQLVLTLVKVLHELLKRQALRRVETGSLTLAEMERLGVTLMRQAQEIERLAHDLGLEPGDLNLDLGPLGKLL